MKDTLNNQVRAFRSKNKVTQEELAKAIGVSRQTIISIEKGNYTPSITLALRIANFFKMSVNEIFSLSTPETNTSEPIS